jgi:teichuronic acid exporter
MSLTNKIIGGVFWAFSERFGTQILQLIIFIVLARILEPEAFGLIGLIAIFIAVSASITDSGFGDALIQKKNSDDTDYSSVFYINLIVSGVMYLVLYVSAPLIASFFNESILIELIRLLGLKFIISAFSVVQVARLMKGVEFKKLMFAKLPSTLLGGTCGIIAAYHGYGVWSLVIQQLTDATAFSIQVWIQSKWIPKRLFNWQRVKNLFSFGSKMMIESILNTLYKNFSEVVIGRSFSMAEVGFYTQANKIKQVPISNLSSAISKVSYPVLAEIQDQNIRLKKAYKKIIRQVFFMVSPIMIGLIVIAEPLFTLLLTEKWLPAVPYFQWLCIGGLLYPVQSYNLNILKVKGRSDLFLYLGIIKKTIGIAGILVFAQISVLAIVMFKAANSVLAYFINSYYSGKFIDYGILEQIKDIWKFIASAALAGITAQVILNWLNLNDAFSILTGVVTAGTTYFLTIYFIEKDILSSSKALLLNFKDEGE